MAATLSANTGGRDDNEYQQALHYFHTGQWQEAITAIESLIARYPSDPRLARMLEDARFKANLDARSTVREKRWIVPWRAILMRVVMIVVVIVMLVIGVTLIQSRVLPMIASLQQERQQQLLLAEAAALMASGDFAGAMEQYTAILAKYPDLAAAVTGLASAQRQQELFGIYSKAVAAEQNGDDIGALALYSELQVKSPGYRDVGARILAIRHRGELADLYNQASTLKALGLEPEAISTLMQIQALDVNYRQQEVRKLLHALNLKQGQRIINAEPPEPAQAPQALDFFNTALEQIPNDAVALTEARLAVGFIAGRDAYNNQQWAEAVSRLRTVYNERSNYLGGTVVNLLYQALIYYGDQVVNDSLITAYEQYSQACTLPVPDTVTACAKASDIIPLLTPTPTPTLSPTPVPTAEPLPSATPTPTPTPRPLAMFRNRIVFKSDNPEAEGYYVMNPDGSNREYLGPLTYYDDAFNAMRETERFSPDGKYRVSTAKVDGRAQVILHLPHSDQWGDPAPKVLTRLTGIAYDPVWAPDGGWIAFTTDENESDDIWKIRPDSSQQESLMRNDWEWDKHPSFSPDSQRIAFFSNRFGDRQIFIMDANGQNVTNISNVPWAEYEPIWIK